ncbi:MAG: hypothetical protein AAB513_01255 [Patescibacteria group bacterium]
MEKNLISFAKKNLYAVIFLFVLGVFLLIGNLFKDGGVTFKSSEFSFYSLSPNGELSGRSIPASCPSDLHDDPTYGTSCQSALNSCGATAPGTYQCGGVCNATVPPVPADLGTTCSVTNSCGVSNSGTRQCDGSCSAQTLPLPNGAGQYCQSQPNNCGVFGQGYRGCSGACGAIRPADDLDCNDVEIEVGTTTATTIPPNCEIGGPDCEVVTTIIPRESEIVGLGGVCSIVWDASPATRCTIVGPGVNKQNEAPTGLFITPRIGVDTVGSATYTITCYNGNTVAATKRFSCRLNPNYQEI